ncbi:MAG TPA: HAMP domain-containing sensor histidine kinase [Thermoguttaceae bacterium]|nr:HAMP domain-containing sensor histidine kinase [Thermoguttaceae bacterium]
MRWPIRVQLLLWILSVVVFGIVAATLASAYLAVETASRAQLADLHQARDTLARGRYPLSQSVLEQLSGLSGGQFVLLDGRGRMVHATLAIDAGELPALLAAPRQSTPDLFAAENVVRLGGNDYFSEQVPMTGRPGASESQRLIVLYPKHRWWSIARDVAAPILIAGGVTTLAAMLVSALVAGRFVRPIRLLRNQADRIADGRFQPVDVPARNDEIGDLTRSINRMTERLGRYEEEVRRHERLRVLGQLGAGMAHQLRNAATGARMAVELHQQETPGAAEDESLGIAMRQLRLMESHLQRFLSLGRDAAAPHEPVTLGTVVESVASLVRPGCDHAGIRLDCRAPEEPIVVRGDAHWLGQLLTNLVINAMEAATRRSEPPEKQSPAEVGIELARVGLDRAVLRVTNNGPEPDAAVQQKMFEPFVTDKPEGTGLGLYLVRQVAEDHGGSVGWERREGVTRFTVELPTLEPQMNADERG